MWYSAAQKIALHRLIVNNSSKSFYVLQISLCILIYRLSGVEHLLVCLQVFGSLVTVKGTLQLLGNNAQTSEGGAMYIQAFGQVKLYDGAVVDFRENRGR